MSCITLSIAVILAGTATTRAEDSAQKITVSEPLKFTRLYADADGESHFSDEELPFELKDFAPPAPPISVSKFFRGKGAVVISSPAGWHGDWHPAP
jgi:hypothetical protein